MSPSLSNFRRKWPTPFEKQRLRQISAHNVSTARDSKKVQLQRPRAFQRTIDGVRLLPLSPLKCGSKSDFFSFLSKSQLQSNEVCYKVSLCENFQQKSKVVVRPFPI